MLEIQVWSKVRKFSPKTFRTIVEAYNQLRRFFPKNRIVLIHITDKEEKEEYCCLEVWCKDRVTSEKLQDDFLDSWWYTNVIKDLTIRLRYEDG